jgi:hypothetical protein
MPEPASTLTRIGNEFKFQIGVGSPLVFTNFCAVYDSGTLGEAKPQIDVTSLCDTARTYRGGLADGLTIALKTNFLQGDATIRAMYAAYQAGTIQTYRLKVDNTSPAEYFQFKATILGWNVTNPIGARADVSFSLKITGPVTWHYT